jgi:Family of unknown function (DUF6261)
MEIQPLHLSILRNEEHYQFNIDFSNLVTNYSAATLGITLLYPAYQAALAVETKSLDIVRGSATTDELADVDTQRDSTFIGLDSSVKSMLFHFDATTKAAAMRIKKLLDTYGDIAEKPYDQETGAITKLVNDLQGDYSADATLLGINAWVVELQRLNIQFDTLKNSRYAEGAAKPQENLKLARKQTDKVYKDIVKRINALVVINGETEHRGFVVDLNERITNYNNLLAQRHGRNAKAKGNDAKSNDVNNTENK